MKKTIENGINKERVISYIPLRYILNLVLIFLEIMAVIAILSVITIYVPYFYLAIIVTQIVSAISIIASNDNPDYKLPWLFFVLLIPIIGFMLYFMFYSRKLNRKQQKNVKLIKENRINLNDENELKELQESDKLAYLQAIALKKLSSSHLYKDTKIKFFSLGDEMFPAMIEDLKKAEKFIFLEYFIIEQGLFWNSILHILKEKIAEGIDIRLIYDDIGCMMTLPGNYYKQLKKIGITCTPFSKLSGQANNKFNNRSHRKIMVIDGKIGYTGGINLADEYINHIKKHGHWKDGGIRLEGQAVNELTRLFLIDYNLNVKAKEKENEFSDFYDKKTILKTNGYCIPFGDGPKPIYERQVAKTAILNLLNNAKEYVYITTPYLIIDNEIASAIENTAIRGVDVHIITPHIPDKKLVFLMTRSYYSRFIKSGVKIYEYKPGFIHEKTYVADGKIAIIGTINLDYRSLVHHFENGVWMYRCEAINDLVSDFLNTKEKSILFNLDMVKVTLRKRIIFSLVKIFAPLL